MPSPRPTRPYPRNRATGFTLVELMITVAVIGILAVFAVPAASDMINNGRISGTAGELQSMLQYARSEAVRSNASVTACAAASGITCSASANRFVVFETGGAKAQLREITMPTGASVQAPATGVVFRPSGLTRNPAIVCVTTSNSSNNLRGLNVLVSGLVAMKKDCNAS